jgi:hypothetical protein
MLRFRGHRNRTPDLTLGVCDAPISAQILAGIDKSTSALEKPATNRKFSPYDSMSPEQLGQFWEIKCAVLEGNALSSEQLTFINTLSEDPDSMTFSAIIQYWLGLDGAPHNANQIIDFIQQGGQHPDLLRLAICEVIQVLPPEIRSTSDIKQYLKQSMKFHATVAHTAEIVLENL